jgi:hypothetical protein
MIVANTRKDFVTKNQQIAHTLANMWGEHSRRAISVLVIIFLVAHGIGTSLVMTRSVVRIHPEAKANVAQE